ncbi:DUF501 domain-containing protein [Haliea salexigens]|nr:DUF501 domain-containing protein [Haliea salexigens]|tara:strand:- start:400 stop:912 length:513 start_codon:yes stop_codon:yes gene_type:complete
MTVLATQRAQVAERLGREPRGLREIAVADEAGHPRVIRVASLVERTPFPTMFWLVDPALNYRIDREEASGLIARFQRQVDEDPALQKCMAEDHAAHIKLRDEHLTPDERQALEQLGFADVLRQRGIGGIADSGRIRCLHTWYAAHLVVPNTIGRLLDAHWAAQPAADGEA